MGVVQQVAVEQRSLAPLVGVYEQAELAQLLRTADALNTLIRGKTVWNINSTAQGGGVAEMLGSLVPYACATGVDCRWVVIGGESEFFVLTKRLHNAIHGFPGDDTLFSERGLHEFERISAQNADELLAMIKPSDVVVLHDPQTLGLAPYLAKHGAYVIWRCHIGTNTPNEHSQAAYRFLFPYLQYTHVGVFTRAQYVPLGFPRPVRILAPTIDPLSVKNQYLTPQVTRAILVQAGLVEGPDAGVAPEYTRPDGTVGCVRRGADVIHVGRACSKARPCILQVSRWDRLKDFLGVLQGFAHFVAQGGDANLILAGPSVHAVADDPEGAEIFDEVLAAFRALPDEIRARVELANLPMADADENAAIVNALQRHTTVIVQKSLQEGFGLTVAEAMWKVKPVIATNVGGISDQIEPNVSGILLRDPHDYAEFSAALGHVLENPAYAAELGHNAKRRVRDHFLNLRSLYVYADIITEVLGSTREGRPGPQEDLTLHL